MSLHAMLEDIWAHGAMRIDKKEDLNQAPESTQTRKRWQSTYHTMSCQTLQIGSDRNADGVEAAGWQLHQNSYSNQQWKIDNSHLGVTRSNNNQLTVAKAAVVTKVVIINWWQPKYQQQLVMTKVAAINWQWQNSNSNWWWQKWQQSAGSDKSSNNSWQGQKQQQQLVTKTAAITSGEQEATINW